jgi:hypothetical protein
MQPAFDDQKWKTGQGGFGKKGTPGLRLGTDWNTQDIWLRRIFKLKEIPADELKLSLLYDEEEMAEPIRVNAPLGRDTQSLVHVRQAVRQDGIGKSAETLFTPIRSAKGYTFARVQILLHVYDTYSGLRITSLYSGLDTGGSPVAGKQRGVHIDTTVARHLQESPGQDLTVGHHHDQIGLKRSNLSKPLPHSHLLRLHHGNTEPGCDFLDSRRTRLCASTHRPVRLRHQTCQITLFGHHSKRRQGDLPGPHEQLAHDMISDDGFQITAQPAFEIWNLNYQATTLDISL